MTIITSTTSDQVRGMTYGQLKTAIATRLSRTDLSAVIPDFIAMGETLIYYGMEDIELRVPPLRLRSMLTTETASLAALPDGFLAVSRFTVPDSYGPRALEYKTPQEFASLWNESSYPRYYTLQDGAVEVQGGTPAEFTFGYYKKFDPLVNDADTNWLLTNNPRVYLYAALIEAYQHLKDDARAASAARTFAAAINGMTASDQAEKYSGSTLTMPTGRT